MKTLARLIVPVLLGLAAGGLNWWAMQKQLATYVFIKVKDDLPTGKPILESNLEPLEIQGSLEAISKAAVPYKDRAVLFNRTSGRDLHKGDLILWRDASPPPPTRMLAAEGEELLPISLDGISIVPRLLQVGDQVGFLLSRGRTNQPATGRPNGTELELEHVGPYRVLSVGERLGRRLPNEKLGLGSGDERVITVAIKRGRDKDHFLDSDSQRLVEAMDAMHNRRESDRRVISILLKPTPPLSAPEGQ